MTDWAEGPCHPWACVAGGEKWLLRIVLCCVCALCAHGEKVTEENDKSL